MPAHALLQLWLCLELGVQMALGGGFCGEGTCRILECVLLSGLNRKLWLLCGLSVEEGGKKARCSHLSLAPAQTSVLPCEHQAL